MNISANVTSQFSHQFCEFDKKYISVFYVQDAGIMIEWIHIVALVTYRNFLIGCYRWYLTGIQNEFYAINIQSI